MRVAQDFYAFLCVAALLGFNCEAEFRLPAPGNLSYEWLDDFTVNVSWEKPGNVTEGCDVKYEVNADKGASDRRLQIQTVNTHYVDHFLTEEMGGAQWELTVEALDCRGERSRPGNITVRTRKRRAEVVDDFKCIVEVSQANCSWIPKDPSHNTSLSYRICGTDKNHLKDLTECDDRYSDGERHGCRVTADWLDDVCMKLESEAGLETFVMERVITPPKMSVSADREVLNLTWAPPDIAEACAWEYQVSYKECGQQKHRSYPEAGRASKHGPLQITYRPNCRYEFRFNVSTHESCRSVRSDGSGSLTFGTETQPESLMPAVWVACVLSTVLSASLVLSCYCARKHRAILCPVIPDPSAMFKEMMMNGSKELKAATTLYEPVPETVEQCKITLATENSPENS